MSARFNIKYAFLSLFFIWGAVSAQDITDASKKKSRVFNISDRPKDHFMIQLANVGWLEKPDTFSINALSRSVGVYLMLDLAFKTDPRFSIGLGAGVGSDHVFFNKGAGRDLVINSSQGVQFKKNEGADAGIQYKSIKLHTAYLEAPVELRFMQKPDKPQKSFKFALGMKVGTLITAVDKTRFNRDAEGNGGYNSKIKDIRNFNSLRLAGVARIGYGVFGAFVQYQLNDFIKEGQGPNQIRPLHIGITISGL
jgi:hypothetical protein